MFSTQGLIFSNVTEFRSNLTSLTSALADVLHPNAYLVVYPVRRLRNLSATFAFPALSVPVQRHVVMLSI